LPDLSFSFFYLQWGISLPGTGVVLPHPFPVSIAVLYTGMGWLDFCQLQYASQGFLYTLLFYVYEPVGFSGILQVFEKTPDDPMGKGRPAFRK
jgi:hypothetical protein